MKDYSRLDLFLTKLTGEVYPEEPSEPHLTITRDVIASLFHDGTLKAGCRVLDVGCGQGLALEHFQNFGAKAIGVALGSDVEVCRKKGFEIVEGDQSFLPWEDGTFDFLWCRHVVEHSFAPMFTLAEYFRLVRAGGRVYVEVPAPDTACHHERNPNHYSVLTQSSWVQLMTRVGFQIERISEYRFETKLGPDLYWAFHLLKA